MKKKLVTATIFIDLSKAFDSIDHTLLMTKLRKIGLSVPFTNLLESYLSSRVQFVELGNVKSLRSHISKGVFQGYLLKQYFYVVS